MSLEYSNHRDRRLSPQAGLTLIEILVVVAILAILAGIVGLSLINEPGKARVVGAQSQLKILKSAVHIYKMNAGQIPTAEQGLNALVAKPTIEPIPRQYDAEGYLDSRSVPLDPWDNEYVYLVPGRSGEAFEIISYGKDGEPGGIDDAADLSTSDI
jgi:general secretion pathway protein G